MMTKGRPLRRQKTACWENEFCLRNLRAPTAAALLLFFLLSETSELLQMYWTGEGGSEEVVKLVWSDSSSMLSWLRGTLGGVQRSASAKLTQRSGADEPAC